jgi:type I restriction enzyme R subunit
MTQHYGEFQDSQKPAIDFLQKLGWQYISPDKSESLRGDFHEVLLKPIVIESLGRINSFEYHGKRHAFSDDNLQKAYRDLQKVQTPSLLQTCEAVYDLISLPHSYTESVEGDQKAYNIKYIDWGNPANNVYHVTEEYIVEGIKQTRRPDLVLFINGIPLVVIENKRRDKNESTAEAISQHLRNQREKEGIPKLFHYAQLLLAVQPNEVKYAVTGTEAKFWSLWKEDNESEVQNILKKKDSIGSLNRLPTAQDRALMSLCEPQRLLDIIYKFIVFDGPIKKICRYQQYFAVQESVERVKKLNNDQQRQGGVIWHTTGSGKSLTMVMLSKALSLEPSIKNPRVVVVTDRINLDKQISKTFKNCGKDVYQAHSGEDLVRLLGDNSKEVITTILDKFHSASKLKFVNESENIFVLVDESHRSQYGSANSTMRKSLPNACYIGFTGTPLLKKEKSTAQKFGGFIHKYTIEQAVSDGAVLPLLYEGRAAKLEVNQKGIDKGFDRLAENLNENARKDLKKKFSSISQLYESDRVVEEIAFDISKHFTTNWQNSGLKAQLAVPKIDTAIKYQRYFEQQTNPKLRINTRVVFTPPDSRKDYDDVWKEASNEARKYWDSILQQFSNQDTYETWVIDKFKEESNEVELIIVVSKLLTGFDAPRNTILYLAKPLHSHNLLQAIARVNRLFEGKDHGYIVDYVGLLGKLDEALTSYSAFEDFEEQDLKATLLDASTEIYKVPKVHEDLWKIFQSIKNKEDVEALERHLAPKDIRDDFYNRYRIFLKTLQGALSLDEFYEHFSAEEISTFRKDLRFFEKLKSSVQRRYADVISYKEYEPRIKKLIDTYVDADEVQGVTDTVDIMNKGQVSEALASYGKTPASQADYISSKMKRVITENMEKDEAFYKKFSALIKEAIDAFNQNRIDEKEYLEKIMGLRDDMQEGHLANIPARIRQEPIIRAYFGALEEVLSNNFGEEAIADKYSDIANLSEDIKSIIEKLIIRDWKRNRDVENEMRDEIENYLLENADRLDLPLFSGDDFSKIDEILFRFIKIAKANY